MSRFGVNFKIVSCSGAVPVQFDSPFGTPHCQVQKVRFAAKVLQQDLLNLAMWCAKWRIKLNPEKNQGDYILQVRTRKKNRTQPKTVWRDTKRLSSSEISRNYFRLPTHFQKALRGHPGPLQYQVSQKVGT